MSITMKLEGGDTLKQRLKDGLKKLTQEMADDYRDELEKETPYKTGNASRGWRLKKTKNGAKINNRVPYISRLEDGYSSLAKEGMTTPAKKTIEALKKSGKYKMNKRRK